MTRFRARSPYRNGYTSGGLACPLEIVAREVGLAAFGLGRVWSVRSSTGSILRNAPLARHAPLSFVARSSSVLFVRASASSSAFAPHPGVMPARPAVAKRFPPRPSACHTPDLERFRSLTRPPSPPACLRHQAMVTAWIGARLCWRSSGLDTQVRPAIDRAPPARRHTAVSPAPACRCRP